MIDNEKILEILGAAIGDAARMLADKVAAGDASAADIAQMRAMFKEAGGTASFGKPLAPTRTGDAILESLRDVDPELLN